MSTTTIRKIAVRPATVADLDAMLALENRSFRTDLIPRRSFLRFLRSAGCSLLVAEDGATFAGYVLVLYRANTNAARIYSIAVNPDTRGLGVGERLVAAAEQAARARHCNLMRLEVRPDNTAALRLYEKNGYRRFAVAAAFYEDGTDALRLEKSLA